MSTSRLLEWAATLKRISKCSIMDKVVIKMNVLKSFIARVEGVLQEWEQINLLPVLNFELSFLMGWNSCRSFRNSIPCSVSKVIGWSVGFLGYPTSILPLQQNILEEISSPLSCSKTLTFTSEASMSSIEVT